MDGHRIRRAKKVQKRPKKLVGKITLFFLPQYFPQLYPDELVWGQVKQRVGKQRIKSKADLKTRGMSALRSLQKLPEKTKGFFRVPTCQYANAE